MPIEILWWFAGWSLVAIGLTVYDKIAAKSAPRHRIPEATLLTVAAVGGAAAMEAACLLIRHKTRHPKFMVSLPLLIVLHAGLLLYLWFWKGMVL